jgi:anti-anti-sigma regulatory factor
MTAIIPGAADHHRTYGRPGAAHLGPVTMAAGGGDVGTRVGASDIDPVTGPMPVVDIADGHLHVSARRDVTIVALDGGLDDALAAEVTPELASATAGAAAVALDLDRVTLLDRTALEAVCAVLDALPDDVDRCIVSGRLSGRLVLDRWDVGARFAIFSSIADALQARTFVASGYGNGWDPSA